MIRKIVFGHIVPLDEVILKAFVIRCWPFRVGSILLLGDLPQEIWTPPGGHYISISTGCRFPRCFAISIFPHPMQLLPGGIKQLRHFKLYGL